MTLYNEMLGVFPADLSTPEAPTAKVVLSVIASYGDAGVLVSVLRNRFRRAPAEHVMRIVSALSARDAVEITPTGRTFGGAPALRITAAKGAVNVLDPMSGLRGRILNALRSGAQPLSALAHKLRPIEEKSLLHELRTMYRDGLIWSHPPRKYVYPASEGKRPRTSTVMVFELKSPAK